LSNLEFLLIQQALYNLSIILTLFGSDRQNFFGMGIFRNKREIKRERGDLSIIVGKETLKIPV